MRLREILLQERARGLPLEARRLHALMGERCEPEQLAPLPPSLPARALPMDVPPPIRLGLVVRPRCPNP